MRSRSVSVVLTNDRHCADITPSVDSRCVRSHQLQSPTNGTILRSSLSARDIEGELDRKGDTRNESRMTTDEHRVADISSCHNPAQYRDSSCLGPQADLICGRAQATCDLMRPLLPRTTRHAKSEPMVNSSDELFSSRASGVLFTSASSCPTDQWSAANNTRRRSISLSQAGTLFVCVDDDDEDSHHDDGTLDHSNEENGRGDQRQRREAGPSIEQPLETSTLQKGAAELKLGRGTGPSTPIRQPSLPLPHLLIQNSVSRLRELREKLSMSADTATTNSQGNSRKAHGHVDECDYWYSGERSVVKRGGQAAMAGVEERSGDAAHSTCNSVVDSPPSSGGGELQLEEPIKIVYSETHGSGDDDDDNDGNSEYALLQRAEEEYRVAQQAILSSCSLQQRQVAAPSVLLEKKLDENREFVYESNTESDCCEKTLEEHVTGKGKKRSREAKVNICKERRARKGVRSEKIKVEEKNGGEAQEKPDRKKNFFVFYTRADLPYATISAPPTGPYSSSQGQIKEEDQKPPIPNFPIELTRIIEEGVGSLTKPTRKQKSHRESRRVVSVPAASDACHAKDHEKSSPVDCPEAVGTSNGDGEQEVLENRESITAPPIESGAESRRYPREEKEIETRDCSPSRRVLAETLSKVFARVALAHQSGGSIAPASGKKSVRRLRETKGKAEAAAESSLISEISESENVCTTLSDGSLVGGFGSDCDKYHCSGASRLLQMTHYYHEGRSELSFGDAKAEVDTATSLSSEHSLEQLVTAATEWTQEHAAYHDACVDERSRFAYYQRANGGRSRLDQSSSRRPASPRHLAALNKDDEHWWSRQEVKCVAAGGAHLMKAILLGLGGMNVDLTADNTP